MKSLTINLAAKNPRYGVTVQIDRYDREFEAVECRITGKGLHQRLVWGQFVDVRIISDRQRLLFSGLVRYSAYGDEPETIIRLDGKRITYCFKRSKWRIVRA